MKLHIMYYIFKEHLVIILQIYKKIFNLQYFFEKISKNYKLQKVPDSNWWIHKIGSLANCWFKPLTQPSKNRSHFIILPTYKLNFFAVMTSLIH